MNREQLEEQIILGTLGLLSEEEQQQAERAIAAEPELRALREAMDEVATMLAYYPERHEPPAELKNRILLEIDRRTAAAPAQGKIIHLQWLPWAIAALLAVFAGALFFQQQQTLQQLTSLQQQLDQSVDREQDLRYALLRPASIDSAAIAQVQWNLGRTRGKMIVRGLEVVPEDRAYQIWIIAPGRDLPVSGGIFVVRADGSAEVEVEPDQPVTGVERFLVSLERAGGVPKAEGPVVLAGS